MNKYKNIEYLIKGYTEFHKKYFQENTYLYNKLDKEGQDPRVLMIACCDSRVDPAIVLKCAPGDLFVIRNVANLIPPYEIDSHYHGTSAAIEFAMNSLNVEHIIVFGHSECGGIKYLMNNSRKVKPRSFISQWLKIARPAYDKTSLIANDMPIESQIEICARFSIIDSLKNLMTFPWIKKKVEEELLYIHGWYIDLQTGTILDYNAEEDRFNELNL